MAPGLGLPARGAVWRLAAALALVAALLGGHLAAPPPAAALSNGCAVVGFHVAPGGGGSFYDPLAFEAGEVLHVSVVPPTLIGTPERVDLVLNGSDVVATAPVPGPAIYVIPASGIYAVGFRVVGGAGTLIYGCGAATTAAVAGAAAFGAATATLTAAVTSGGAPVPAGGAVTFRFNGHDYPATTDAQGVATATAPLPPGTLPGSYPGAVQASYAGTAGYAPSQGAGPLVVAAPDCAARFADVANADPACPAIYALSQAGVIQGFDTTPPTFGPDDDVQRAQQAAFLVRALGWERRPIGPRDFSDFDGLVQELQDAARILAKACAVPADDTTCVARGYGDGTFGPTDPVSHAQVIAFIARAFQFDPAYAWAPGAPAPGTPAQHAADIGTYIANAGTIPDAPTSPTGWDAPASRAWVATVLWQALLSAP